VQPQRGLLKKYKREYVSYGAMKARCGCTSDTSFKDYGGRGITVCDRWLGPGGFVNFILDMGRRPEGKTLDRRNPEGNYEPNNCRWASARTQVNNRRCSYTKEELAVLQTEAESLGYDPLENDML